MAFQAVSGHTFLFPTRITETAHLWIVITEPTEESDDIVVVNVTSRRNGSDTTVTLNPGHHPFIRKPSVINFSNALFVKEEKIKRSIQIGEAEAHEPVDTSLLKRIKEGILISPRTPLKIKAFCRQCFDK